MNRMARPVVVVLALLVAATARADDVTDALERARKAYAAGEIAKARDEVTLAGTLLGQQRIAQFAALLPSGRNGWTATETNNNSGGVAMAMLGIHTERIYERGDQRLTLSLMADSPMVAGLSSLFRSGLMGMTGTNRMVRVNGEMAMFDESAASLTVLVDNRILVKAEGSNLKLQDLQPFIEAIDLAAARKL